MNSIENIVFYYPSKVTGGAQLYCIRYAEQLASHPYYRIYYVDFEDGFSHKYLDGKVRYINYDNAVVSIPDNSVVLMQLNLIRTYRDLFVYNKENCRLMFLMLHFLNLRGFITYHGLYSVSSSYRRKVSESVEKLSEAGIIKYLGFGAQIEISKDFYFKPLDLDYLPQILQTRKYGNKSFKKEAIGNVIRFCWLGRLDFEKARNIMTYMNELDVVHMQHSLEMYIIGLGDYKEKLESEASKHDYPIHFVGEKRDDELDVFIRKNVDIGLASGTSSLEFAMRKTPVIEDWVLDRVYKAGERKEYNLVSETKDVDMSVTNRIKRLYEDSFSNLLERIMLNYQEQCEKSFEYSMTKSEEHSCERMIAAVKKIEGLNYVDYYQHINAISDMLNTGKRRIDFIAKLLHFNRI